MIFQDFLKRPIDLETPPRKVVSLVPSQTELIADLGLEDQLVGITKFCVHPKHLRKSKNIVGGTKQVHFDKIKALEPDIIFCNKEENTKHMVDELQKIAPVHVSEVKTLDDNIRLIHDYGKILQAQLEANRMITDLKMQIKSFKSFINNKPLRRVAYLIWRDPWMAVGGNTFINHILKLNHFENVYENKGRYPTIDLNNLPDLDLLFLSSEPYPFKAKHYPEIPIDNSNIKLVNGEYFSWYGSRMLKAFDYFINYLH